MALDTTFSGNLVDPLAARIFPATLHIRDGRIAGITPQACAPERFIMPGFVDAHVHIESSMLPPAEFARLAAAHGTVATVSDPHEVANVLGVPGVEFMITSARQAAIKLYFGAPACVPATPFETAGASLGPQDVAALLERPDILFLSEMMNFPGVLSQDPQVMAKLAAARRAGKPVDGHAPGLRGDDLRRYVAAGITTDHESLSLAEAQEKVSLGMKVLLRQGSAARGFQEMAELVETSPDMVMLCSDDKHPDDLAAGHIADVVRQGVALGLNTMKLLRAACVNPVLHYGLDVGLLRPGDPADFIVVDNLQDFRVMEVYVNGAMVAREGASVAAHQPTPTPNTFAVRPKAVGDFAVPVGGSRLRVIGALDGSLVTETLVTEARTEGGCAVADPSRDLLKLAVVNRYRDAPPAVAFIRGFGLREGALAASVAHDSHNIIAVGASDEALCAAVNGVIAQGGGLAVVSGQGMARVLPLPIAGLMSDAEGYAVAKQYHQLDAAAKALGSPLSAPFMTLSFMALLVIPHLKLSDRGLFDSERFAFTPLFV